MITASEYNKLVEDSREQRINNEKEKLSSSLKEMAVFGITSLEYICHYVSSSEERFIIRRTLEEAGFYVSEIPHEKLYISSIEPK
jgi:hypothetical protein